MFGFALDGGIDRIGEARAGGRADRVEDLCFVGEVAIRRHRAAADFLSERAHRHTLVSVSGEESRRGGAERVAEIVELILGEGGSRHGHTYTT